ncbi:MAG: MBL fold metallo-hydrolase [Pseudomonadota bacterium]
MTTPRHRQITYPLTAKPDVGEWQHIDEDLVWLRMPLPITLGSVNVFLLRDGDGWAAVDTGMQTPDCQAVWERARDEVLGPDGATRVLVTHMHPDHVGMAGWLCRESSARLWMPRLEYFLCRILVADTGREAPTDGVAFYRAAGLNDEEVARYQNLFGMFGRVVSTMPDAYVRVTEGDMFDTGHHRFEVLSGNGHSPEHACLLDRERNLFIAGDQLLPTISSNVSVWPTEPDANPLAGWLDSCHRLREALPEDVLVLPGHGKPFTGAHERLTQLIDEHEKGLAAITDACASPKRAVDLFPQLFKSPITDANRTMATGEAVAHVNYLLATGDLEIDDVRDGVRFYKQS